MEQTFEKFWRDPVIFFTIKIGYITVAFDTCEAMTKLLVQHLEKCNHLQNISTAEIL